MNRNKTNLQAASSVIMCRPHHFIPNPQTLADNTFQTEDFLVKYHSSLISELSLLAFKEVSHVAKQLSQCGVMVHLFEDKSTETPDSVFPNNWFSTHSNGMVGVYPMYSKNRRKERRTDILELLKSRYRVTDIVDYSEYEKTKKFLEGTGALVLDHVNGLAYGSISKRLDRKLFQKFCKDFGYSPILFKATNDNNIPVYHTNVLMNVSTNFSLICLSMIRCDNEKSLVKKTLEASGKAVIELSENQIRQFAGNALELSNGTDNFLAMSKTAFNSLSIEQIETIEKYVSIKVFAIPTIERAGGSIRCMLAEIHLQLQ